MNGALTMNEDQFDRYDRECRETPPEPEDRFTVQVEVVNADGRRVYALLPRDIPVEEQARTVGWLADQGGMRV